MKNIIRTIVIPAYAEEDFIEDSLSKLHDLLMSKGWLDSTEVIVVTANSPDKTQQIAASLSHKFPNFKHVEPGDKVGKGRDVKAGLSTAKGNYVLFMDADLATPLHHIEDAFNKLELSGGMLIGVRKITSMHKTLLRRASSLLSNALIRIVVGIDIKDSQCGFKGFDRNTLEKILPRSKINGWGFDFEFIKIAKIHHINIQMLPITDWKDPKPEGKGLAGESQLNAMKKTLKELLEVKKNQMSGLYK